MKKKKSLLKKLIIMACSMILLIIGTFTIYVNIYYHADYNYDQLVSNRDDNLTIKEEDSFTIIEAEGATTGFIFYPGAKVEETAYLPLLMQIAENGITCVLVEMPFRLAIMGKNKADKVYDKLPQIEGWYIGGHSLGGAMASSYALKNEDKLRGIIFLGAYATGNHTIDVITIYGSEDQVINHEKLANSPNQALIEGGNHAYFGNYGEQKGDGVAIISREKQQELCVALITNFIKE